MKKTYIKPIIEVIELIMKTNVLITVSSSTQSNEEALGRESDFDFEDEEY